MKNAYVRIDSAWSSSQRVGRGLIQSMRHSQLEWICLLVKDRTLRFLSTSLQFEHMENALLNTCPLVRGIRRAALVWILTSA